MTNETVGKYKIELNRREIRMIQFLIFKKFKYGCDDVDAVRDYVEIYDKLEKTLERE